MVWCCEHHRWTYLKRSRSCGISLERRSILHRHCVVLDMEPTSPKHPAADSKRSMPDHRAQRYREGICMNLKPLLAVLAVFMGLTGCSMYPIKFNDAQLILDEVRYARGSIEQGRLP